MFLFSLLFQFVKAEILETHSITVHDQKITVEIADELHERQKGLMFRESLEENAGMLFVYPMEKELRFWMKNTSIPLSIAYLDQNGVILLIADMKPYNLQAVSSEKPALYALEMNQGWFEKNKVKEGMRVDNLPKAK